LFPTESKGEKNSSILKCPYRNFYSPIFAILPFVFVIILSFKSIAETNKKTDEFKHKGAKKRLLGSLRRPYTH